MEIFNTTVNTADDILEGTQQTITFDITLFSDPKAGSVNGTELLELVMFLSLHEDASGTRHEVTGVDLEDSGFFHITAGIPTDILGLTAYLNLRDGPTCSQFDYLCVEVARGDSPSVDFTFSGSTSSSLIGCQQITCIGSHRFYRLVFFTCENDIQLRYKSNQR